MAKIDEAYHRLKADILAARLAPDTPLAVSMLTRRTGLGWTPLREALSRLEAEGLVVSAPNRGYRVAPVSFDSLRDLQVARQTIEDALLVRSVETGDTDWEGRLVAAHHALARAPVPRPDRATEDLELWETRHDAFHAALLSAGDSATLIRFHEQVSDQLRRHHRHMLVDPALQSAMDETARTTFGHLLSRMLGLAHHTRLMDAALARDLEGARTLLGEHIGFSSAVYAFLRELGAGRAETKAPARR